VEASLKTIPDSDKVAYLEALERCPDLVQTESDPLRFARVESFNDYKAARRLVEYWKYRKELFGEQQAFLPMVQTGTGALTKEDIVILSGGCAAAGGNDSAGRNVLLLDRTRLIDKSEAAQKSRLRCIFYMMTVLAEDEASQTKGTVWIANLVSPRMTRVHPTAGKKLTDSIEVMPLGVKAIHFVVVPPKTGKTITEAECSVKQINEHIHESNLDNACVLFHRGSSVEEVSATLGRFGLSPQGLPPCFGGYWKYEGTLGSDPTEF